MVKQNKKGQAITGGILILIGIVALVLYIGFDTVDPGNMGVKVRFGEMKGTMSPGMQYTGVFTSLYNYNLKMRKAEVIMLREIDPATGEVIKDEGSVDKDGQYIGARIEVNYRLNPDNVANAYEKIGLDNQLANILNIDGIIREGFKTATSKRTSTEIWQNRELVKQEAIDNIRDNFPQDYFILENVVISNIGFNKGFTDAIELKKTNEELAKAEEQAVEIAKQQANKAIEDARGKAESAKLQSEAEAYQVQVKAAAEAEALRLKKQELTPLMVQNNWIDAWDGKLPQYMLGSNTDILMQMPTQNEEGIKG